MTSTIAIVVWLCLLPLVPSQLRVDLVLAGRPMKPRVAATAIREARNIWSAYGVDVRWAVPPDAGRGGALELSITLIGGSDPGDLQTLGVTPFVEGRPLPSIRLFPDAVAALLSSEMLVVRSCIRSSDVCQDVLAGRVLGRALAHEIGHYLLASRGHSRKGLMQPRPLTESLIEVDARDFRLSPEDVSLLASRRASPRR